MEQTRHKRSVCLGKPKLHAKLYTLSKQLRSLKFQQKTRLTGVFLVSLKCIIFVRLKLCRKLFDIGFPFSHSNTVFPTTFVADFTEECLTLQENHQQCVKCSQ